MYINDIKWAMHCHLLIFFAIDRSCVISRCNKIVMKFTEMSPYVMCTDSYHYCPLSICSCVLSPSLAIRGGWVRGTAKRSNPTSPRTLPLGTPHFAVVGLWPLLPLVDGRVCCLLVEASSGPVWCGLKREGHSFRWGIASIKLRQYIYWNDYLGA